MENNELNTLSELMKCLYMYKCACINVITCTFFYRKRIDSKCCCTVDNEQYFQLNEFQTFVGICNYVMYRTCFMIFLRYPCPILHMFRLTMGLEWQVKMCFSKCFCFFFLTPSQESCWRTLEDWMWLWPEPRKCWF